MFYDLFDYRDPIIKSSHKKTGVLSTSKMSYMTNIDLSEGMDNADILLMQSNNSILPVEQSSIIHSTDVENVDDNRNVHLILNCVADTNVELYCKVNLIVHTASKLVICEHAYLSDLSVHLLHVQNILLHNHPQS